jgi:small subunit ribosomal protein S6
VPQAAVAGEGPLIRWVSFTPAPEWGPRDRRRWQLRSYEILVIVDPDADEETLGRAVDRVTQVITDQEGTPGSVDHWGKRKLAHEIEKKSEGQYFLVPFQAEPTALTELDRILSLADEVLRFKIVRTDTA